MSSKAASETPLMKQYLAIKTKYPGALLLFRVGDFYETFGEDAIKASKTLNITLTKRSNGAASEMELAGFPHHSLDVYLPKLVRAGFRVAICDQLEDPKSVKGIVKRGVTELVTPGVSYNDNVLDVKKNNYLASVFIHNDQAGVAFLDISTGEFIAAEGTISYIDKLLQSFQPSEVLTCKPRRDLFTTHFGNGYNTYLLEEWIYTHDFGYEALTKHFSTPTLKGFGVESLVCGITAAGAILHYLSETEHHEVKHINAISRIEEDRYVWLDKFTIRNLELIFPQHENGVPLVSILDNTLTPMGSRMLRKWILLPLKDVKSISERHDVVEALVTSKDTLTQLQSHLKPIGDLERIISKVAARRINPRELMQLKRALDHILPIKEALIDTNIPLLLTLADKLNPCDYLRAKIEKELKEDLPIVTNQGGMFRSGIHQELDELHGIAFNGKDFLVQIQQREAERTGIPKLKIAYNKVFGYYLEVSHAQNDKVPSDWIRKQTLVNAERYITEELKIYEEKIIGAEDRIHVIEQQLFVELMNQAAVFVAVIQEDAKVLAYLDCLCSFAQIAITNHYNRPNVNDSFEINIKDGRHPVIEKQLPVGETYVPNDVFLDQESQQIMIITGPNMAGKSALLRQVALISLMAQIGSYVPASEAHIGLVDKIFTRVGASDNLSQGESTFMVEMTETASILNNLSERSLVLMDEIGRGTSTYDGISIAWSIVEYLHNHPKAKARTLFATHYHELNELTNDFHRIKNYNVSVKEVGNRVIFMRKLKEGGSEHSFGIHVAQMAGMPTNVVLRSDEILRHLEKDKIRQKTKERLDEVPKANIQMSLFEAVNPKHEEAIKKIQSLDINTLSPVEALLKLNEIKSLIKD